MSIKKTVTAGFVAGAVALAITGASEAMADDKAAAEKEKCYGVAKAGKNDCGDSEGKHGCAGASTVDGDGTEWVSMPKGLCEKIVGGSLAPSAGDESLIHHGAPKETENEG